MAVFEALSGVPSRYIGVYNCMGRFRVRDAAADVRLAGGWGEFHIDGRQLVGPR